MKSLRHNRQGTPEVSIADSSLHTLTPLEPVHPHDIPNRYELKQERKRNNAPEHKRQKRIRKLATAAIGMGTLVGAGHSAFMYDQNVLADAIWGNNTAYVETLSSTETDPNIPETYIYVLPNTGVKDARQTAVPIQRTFETIPNSTLMSLTEGAHPQISETFEAVDETIDYDNPPERFLLYGTSVGGKEALALANHLRDKSPMADITIVLSSSPYNQGSAYALQGENNILPAFADMVAQSNLHGGPVVRILGSIAMQFGERCHEQDGDFNKDMCRQMIANTIDENTREDTGTTELLQWQIQWTRANTVRQDMHSLRNKTDGPRTNILYINTTQDTIVDEDQAIPLYERDAIENNIPFTVKTIDLPHSTEFLFPERYDKEILRDYFAQIDDIYDSVDARLGSTIRDQPDPTIGTGKPYSIS